MKWLDEIRDVFLFRRVKRDLAAGFENGFLPQQLAIETVNHCNAKCIMCPYTTTKRQKGVMSVGMHRQIIDEVKAMGAPIRSISHAGLGEPLIDLTLIEKINYEKSQFPDAEVTVYSNASLMDEKRAQALLDSRLDRLSVSLNAAREETYKNVMKLDFKKTSENLARFLEMRARTNSKMKFQVSLTPTELHSKEEVEEFQQYWSTRADAVIVPPLIHWGNHFQTKTNQKQYSCRYIWEVLMIDWDGTVKMCCEDYETRYPLGKVGEQSVMKIFNSKMFNQQRQRQLAGSFDMPEICKNCVETHQVAREYWQGNPKIATAPKKISESREVGSGI